MFLLSLFNTALKSTRHVSHLLALAFTLLCMLYRLNLRDTSDLCIKAYIRACSNFTVLTWVATFRPLVNMFAGKTYSVASTFLDITVERSDIDGLRMRQHGSGHRSDMSNLQMSAVLNWFLAMPIQYSCNPPKLSILPNFKSWSGVIWKPMLLLPSWWLIYIVVILVTVANIPDAGVQPY